MAITNHTTIAIMPTPTTKRTEKKFYWFVAVWLVAVAGCVVLAVASGYEWYRVGRWTFSVGLMPIFTSYCVLVVAKRLQQQRED